MYEDVSAVTKVISITPVPPRYYMLMGLAWQGWKTNPVSTVVLSITGRDFITPAGSL
jgi:hypothetical protein